MQSTLIMKFGGAALKTPNSFKRVSEIIEAKRLHYQNIVVVVSAMGNMTNELIDLANTVHPSPPQRELDMLVTIGERVSGSLLSMALQARGIKAISFTGSQSGIITSSDHCNAKILDIRPARIQESLGQGNVVIVAGFQGVSLQKEITTLGRGGSDTSAVALAIALKAEKVEFFKDVGGLYDSDPKKNLKAVHLPKFLLKNALLNSEAVGSVLDKRCLKLAFQNNILLHVKSFDPTICTETLIEPDPENLSVALNAFEQ